MISSLAGYVILALFVVVVVGIIKAVMKKNK